MKTVQLVPPVATSWVPIGYGHVLSFTDWLKKGVDPAVTEVVRRASPLRDDMPMWFPPEPREWELLWGVASMPDFVIDEPLRTIVDQSNHPAHELYRQIWEVRFLTKERVNLNSAQEIVHRTTAWLTGEDIPSHHRYDLLCALLTLAVQNELIEDFNFHFQGLDRAFEEPKLLEDFDEFIYVVQCWADMGSLVNVTIGLDPKLLPKLEEVHPKLAKRLQET